jgi:hypothetical protein
MAEPMSTAPEAVSLRADDPSLIDARVGVLHDAIGAAAGLAPDETPAKTERSATDDGSPMAEELVDAPEARLSRSGSRGAKSARAVPERRATPAVSEAASHVNGLTGAEAPPLVLPIAEPAPPAPPPEEETPYRNGAMVEDAVAYLQSSLTRAEAVSEPVPAGVPREGANIVAKAADREDGISEPDAAVVIGPAAPTASPTAEETTSAVSSWRDVPPGQAATPAKRISPLAGVLIGAAVGAVVSALAIALLLPRVMQSVDLRIAPIIDRITKAELRMQQTDVSIGRLNNDMAKAIDDGGKVVDRVTAQTAELADIQRQLATTQAAAAEEKPDASVFAVAVVQLRSAFYSGRPFEAELVNVFALAHGEDRFVASLDVLSGPARSGVPTAGLLRQQLPAFAAAAGLRIGQPQTYYEYGMSLVGQYVGVATQPYAIEAGNGVVTIADRQLMRGDVAGAVATLAGLDPRLLAVFQPWMDAARVYLRSESAVSDMTAAVIESLRRRMGAASAG